MSRSQGANGEQDSSFPCRVHVLYKGRVQGVGFRFTAERIAVDLRLTGWVRNLPGGDVEIIAEGPESQLKALLEQIQHSPLGSKIHKTVVRWMEYEGAFSDFRVEFTY